MDRLRGYLVRWEAPSNKRDAADYWGHTGVFTLRVAEGTELAVKNAVGGVILRLAEGVSEAMLEGYLGAEVEVEGEFDHGRVVLEGAAEGGEETTDRANEVTEAMPMEAMPMGAMPMEAMPMRSMGLEPAQMAQTLMVPQHLGEDGRVVYQPAPRYEGVGFRVRAVRRCY